MFDFLRRLFGGAGKSEQSKTLNLDAAGNKGSGLNAAAHQVIVKYKELGCDLGEMIRDRFIGQDLCYSTVLNELIKAEEEIAKFRLMPVPIGLFVNVSDPCLISVNRLGNGLRPIMFAALWKKSNTEDDIFSDENLFIDETKDSDDVIRLTVNPKSREIFRSEIEMIHSMNIDPHSFIVSTS